MIDILIGLVKDGFSKIKDTRKTNQTYKLQTMLNLAFSMFHLKDGSLSSYKEQYSVRAENLARVYGVDCLPGDTSFREAVDTVSPKEIQKQFQPQIDLLKSKGILEQRYVLQSLGGFTAVAIDGTGFYCSGAINCPHCLVKKSRNGKESYYHQALGAVAVTPNESTVFPIAAEAIIKQDGSTKNDCELNAAKRIIPQIRATIGTKEEEQIIGIFDALYCNGPLIQDLQKQKISYIIGTKGKTYVDVQVEELRKKNQLQQITWTVGKQNKTELYEVNYANGLILNGKYQNILVNYFEVRVTNKKTGERLYYSTFITDIVIEDTIVKELVDVARCRWKIENETFNTLKNQGYHLEHNYGHGKKNLATNFMLLTFLAFLVDQITQQLDEDFQLAKNVAQTFKSLWEKIRNVFYLIPTMSMNAVYRFISKQRQIEMPPLI
jgi:hypothetical protein